MKKIILISIIAFVFTTSYSQSNKYNQKHSLGVSAGMSHAFGLSYQYWGNEIGLHTSFTPYSNFKGEYMTAFSVAPMATIYERNYSKYFLYEANGVYVSHLWEDNIYLFMPAIGAGSKIWLTEHLNLNIALGLGVLFASSNTDLPEFIMLPDANFGFYYSF